jgi:hypothetical protein
LAMGEVRTGPATGTATDVSDTTWEQQLRNPWGALASQTVAGTPTSSSSAAAAAQLVEVVTMVPEVRSWPSVAASAGATAATTGRGEPAVKRPKADNSLAVLTVIAWAAKLGVCPPDAAPEVGVLGENLTSP